MYDPRIDKLADVLVNYSVGVRPGQLVRISGSATCLPLVESVYERVLRAGGHPMVRLAHEPLEELFVKFASDAQIDYVNPIQKHEVETIDATIGIWAEENTKALSNVDAKRLARSQSARKPVFEVFMKRAAEGSLKWVGTQYPTQACAQDAEMSQREYADFVFGAGLLAEADPVAAWKRLSEKQQRLVDYLTGKSEMRVVAANGTDIRMGVSGRRWINCDGHENFPDGEVFTGPILDSVNGRIRFSFPAVHLGREVVDAELVFRDGRVVDARASKGQDFLIEMLDMDAGSRLLGECAIGTNYGIKRYTRNTLFDEKIGGTVHVALGAGYPETGNTNQSGLHWDMVVDLRSGGRIDIDGQTLSENGRFLIDGLPG